MSRKRNPPNKQVEQQYALSRTRYLSTNFPLPPQAMEKVESLAAGIASLTILRDTLSQSPGTQHYRLTPGDNALTQPVIMKLKRIFDQANVGGGHSRKKAHTKLAMREMMRVQEAVNTGQKPSPALTETALRVLHSEYTREVGSTLRLARRRKTTSSRM